MFRWVLACATIVSLFGQDTRSEREQVLQIARHPEQFDHQALIDAAAKWDRHERAVVHESGNPSRYLQAAFEIAKTVMDRDPALSLEYSGKGSAFAAEHWADTPEFDASAEHQFWPLMLEAHVRLKDWEPADRLGKATLREIATGSLPTALAEEAKVRRLYASVLDHARDLDGAREQLGIAALLSSGEKPAFEAYLVDHPLAPADREKLQSRCSAQAEAVRERRAPAVKADLLASEVKEVGTPLRLKNLNGQDVRLADYRGKALVVAFWATWCGPCMGELDELNRIADRFRDNPRAGLLTVSVDVKANVADFAKQAGYRFPILRSDGSVENAYIRTPMGVGIPQLYVFDPEGNIRFHLRGFEDDGLFERKLDWMIEAALK